MEREQKEGLEHLRRAPGGAHGVRGSFSSQVGYVCFWIGHQRPDASPQAHMLLTNIETLAIHLGRRCEGRHPQHQPLIGGRAAAAAIYTDQFVDSILRALRQHLQLRPEGHPPQDYWSFNGTQLVRHHVHPRMALFNPFHVTNVPVDVSVLGDQRHTTTNAKQQMVDNWRDSGVVSPWPQHWTGTTTFSIADHMVLPNNVAQLAHWCAASGAHALFSFVRNETEFIAEWEQLQHDFPDPAEFHHFPARKILGGGERPADGVVDSVFDDPDEDVGGFSAPVQDAWISSAAVSSCTSSQSSSAPLQSPIQDGAVAPRLRRALKMPTIQEAKGEDALEDKLDMEIERAGREVRGPGASAKTAGQIEEQTLHPELRREIYRDRLHRDLGHPDHERFLRALRHAGVRPEVIRWT